MPKRDLGKPPGSLAASSARTASSVNTALADLAELAELADLALLIYPSFMISLLPVLIAHAAESAEPASGGIGAIGLNLPALLFQILNFAVLLWLLKRFAYKPIIGILENRRLMIAESERTARELETAKTQLKTAEAAIMKQAQVEASRIMAESKKQAAEMMKAADARAQEQTERTIAQTKVKIEQAQTEMRAALKNEVLDLVALATEKIIGTKLDAQKDEVLIQNAISGAEQSQSPQSPFAKASGDAGRNASTKGQRI